MSEELEFLKANTILACASAVAMWLGAEGVYAKQLQSRAEVDEEWIAKWLTQWRLPRTAPLERRAALVLLLNENVVPQLKTATESRNPYEVVPTLAVMLSNKGVTQGRATSLVSKFALSLFPEIYTPYDKYARKGLERIHQVRIKEHDYVAYSENYLRFVKFFESHIIENAAGIQQDALKAGMSTRVFICRSSDKLLMLLGGFAEGRMIG